MDCCGPENASPGGRRALREGSAFLKNKQRLANVDYAERFAQEDSGEGYVDHYPSKSSPARPVVPPAKRNVTSDGWQWIGKPLRYDVHYRFAQEKACVDFRISAYEDDMPSGTSLTGASDDPAGWSIRLDIPSIRRAYTIVQDALLFPKDVKIVEFSYAQRQRLLQFFEMWRQRSVEAEQQLESNWELLVAYHLRRWEVRDGTRPLVQIRTAFASGRTNMASAAVCATAATAHRLRYHSLRHTISDQIHAVDVATSDPVTGVLTSAWGGDRKFDVRSLPPLKVHVRRETPSAFVESDSEFHSVRRQLQFKSGNAEAFVDEWREECDGSFRACSIQ